MHCINRLERLHLNFLYLLAKSRLDIHTPRVSAIIMNLLSLAQDKAVPAADDFVPVLVYVSSLVNICTKFKFFSYLSEVQLLILDIVSSPIWIQVIIKANPPSLLSTVQFVDNFYRQVFSFHSKYWGENPFSLSPKMLWKLTNFTGTDYVVRSATGGCNLLGPLSLSKQWSDPTIQTWFVMDLSKQLIMEHGQVQEEVNIRVIEMARTELCKSELI